MPEVPYSPVPDVAPQATPTPSLHVDTPIAAFGGTVAQAIESVGGHVSKVGDELFTRAMALQDLKNRTDADDAVTKYNLALAPVHGDYTATQGKDAVTGNPKFNTDVADLRDQFGNELNPAAKKLYDSESRGIMARTIFSGATHAGTENKRYQEGTAKAAIATNRDGAYANPDDDAGFQAKWNSVPNHVASLAGVGGWGDEQVAHEVFKERSGLLADRIKGMARVAPLRAEQMLQESKDKMEFTDWQSAYAVAHHEVTTTGSRVAADKINAGWDPRMAPQEIDRATGVQEPLQRIIKKAQQDHPELRFTIPPLGGTRTPEQQAKLVASGNSQTLNSNHLSGNAIDLAPVNDRGQIDFNDKAGYAKIEAAIQQASIDLGIPLGDEHDKIKSWDPGHYSLPRNLDYKSVPTALEEPLQSRLDRGKAWAHEQLPNDADFHDMVENRIRTQFNMDLAAKRDTDFRNWTTVGNTLLGLEGQAPPTTVEELRSNPEAREAYDNLPVSKKNSVLSILARNAKDDFPTNEANFRTYTQLKGEAELDPQQFLSRDIVGMEIPRTWRKELLSLQQAKNKKADQDPAVTHALQVLRSMLQSANVTTQDKDRYSVFIGTLQDQLRQFQHDNKKQPSMEDINTIGARLLQEQHQHFWQSSQGMFEVPVPDDEATKIKSDPAWSKKNVVPTDAMVQRLWIAKKYQDLYGSPAGGTKPAPANPTVPQSK